MTFSVIIPALNEEETIGACVAGVQAVDPGVEIVVVDGGSGDATVARAEAAGARVCVSAPGRGVQCNAGAELVTGDILLFLHADTRLPAGAFSLLRRTFADDRVQVGTFRLSFDEEHWLFSIYHFFSRFDSLFTTFGDQCIVIRRPFFDAIGRFSDWPLFEDVALLQRARQEAKIHSFPAAVVTSARRFRREGVVRQSLCNAWYVLQYLLGASPQALAQAYERTGSDAG